SIPSGGTSAPATMEIVSIKFGGVTAAYTGLSFTNGNALRMYVESSMSIGSDLNISNNGLSPTDVTLSLTNLDGTSAGSLGPLTIPVNGNIDVSVDEIPGIPTPFRGVLRIVSSGASVSVVGVRFTGDESS